MTREFTIVEHPDEEIAVYYRTLCWGTFPTRKEAEAYIDRLHRGDQVEAKAKEWAKQAIESWATQAAAESGLRREVMLQKIRQGIKAALEEACPEMYVEE